MRRWQIRGFCGGLGLRTPNPCRKRSCVLLAKSEHAARQRFCTRTHTLTAVAVFVFGMVMFVWRQCVTDGAMRPSVLPCLLVIRYPKWAHQIGDRSKHRRN